MLEEEIEREALPMSSGRCRQEEGQKLLMKSSCDLTRLTGSVCEKLVARLRFLKSFTKDHSFAEGVLELKV